MFEISIKGNTPTDPRQRVLAIEAAVKAICQEVGEDPADAVMVLLTAAAHLSTQRSKLPIGQLAPKLAEALGSAIVAADQFFTLRSVEPKEG